MTRDEIVNSNTPEAQAAARSIAEGKPLEPEWCDDLRRIATALESIDTSLRTVAEYVSNGCKW